MSKIIAIDAGHGSNTAGKRTPDGYREHWINVRCSYFFELAVKRCGFKTIRSGWDDTNAKDDPDLCITSRQNAIRAAGVDAAFSWHANAYGSDWNSAQGVETIIHSVASKQGDSEKLAKLVQAELIKGTEQKDRGVKTGNFGMCNATYMRCDAAILIEIGFMTSQLEAGLMKTDAFCKEQAEDACRGLCAYYGVKYVPESASADSSTPVASDQKPIYTVGKIYTLQVELKVRTGPGTNYAAKKHDQLTESGKKHDADGDGALDKGTVITCQEVKQVDDDIWIRCPSGWLAAYYNGKKYISVNFQKK
ncbi:MAG: N-acetylmuramoyl-L-alanine amidase [Lachnospiraceae bacterium]|nr:N-acetylmuramoyl-L-alanine amidase [Lachnospiraceae bacterium]